MDITLHLTEEQSSRANELAATLGIATDDIFRAAIADVLNGPTQRVKDSVERIVREDAELYKRLA